MSDFSLNKLNPFSGGDSLASKITQTSLSPLKFLANGDPIYTKLKTGHFSMNPDKNFNRAVQAGVSSDGAHRAVGMSDNTANKTAKVAAGIAALYFGGSAAYNAYGGGEAAGAGGAGAGAGAGAGGGTAEVAAGGSVVPGTGAAIGDTVATADGVGTYAGTSGAATVGGGMTTAQMAKLGLQGVALVGAMKGGKGAAGDQSTLNGLGQPAADASAQLLAQFKSGQLNAADQGNIAKWHQQSLEQSKQYYANAGLSDSSMAQQAEAQIGQQAESMRQQALNNYLQEGLQAAGVAAGPLGQAVTNQLQADQQAQQAQSQFFQTLATMAQTWGSSNG